MIPPTFRHDFHSLSVKDLLEAREAYQVHLRQLDTVFATAIGLYRMDRRDPNVKDPSREAKYGKSRPRTLANTVVTKWSWPCVLVFVNQWLKPKDLCKKPYETVPRRLYLPDGREIPVCVLLVEPEDQPTPRIERLEFPSGLIGGGYPCFTDPADTQGVEQVGTLGGLVTRGGTTYALTNYHVAGRPGKPVYRLVNGEQERLGVSADIKVSKRPFSAVYPGWPGHHTFVNMDAGMIEVDEVDQWTSQVFGIGEIGPLVDFNKETITLDMIGAPVRTFGGVSGRSEGEIYGLFYRYRSIGGTDFVADLLIGPRTAESNLSRQGSSPAPPVKMRPGDSGSFIFMDVPPGPRKTPAAASGKVPAQAPRLSPVAMLWGGTNLGNQHGAESMPFALATFLSTVCRVLDLDLLNDHNTGYKEYWGKTCHFKIGHTFCELLSNRRLKSLLTANRDNIGFPNEDLEKGQKFRVSKTGFVPLADVPDYVWMSQSFGGGKARKAEPLQHFADIDEEGPGGTPSLLAECRKDPDSNLRAYKWREFYTLFDDEDYGPEPAVLPFRVRQVYEAMVNYLRKRKLMHFVAAAGILAHYVADGCIPLHCSVLHHGRGPKVRRKTPKYEKYKKSKPYKVHSLFEQRMFEKHTVELLSGIDRRLNGKKAKPTVTGGVEAIQRFFRLMSESYDQLDPERIIDADDPRQSDAERATLLFNAVGKDAMECVTMGCLALAELVESAWKEGRGDSVLGNSDVETYAEEDLEELYRSSDFLPALTIEDFVKLGY